MSWNNLRVSDDENSEWHNGGCSVEYNSILGTDYESKICENQRLRKENQHLRKHISLLNDLYNEEFDKNRKLKGTIDKAIEYISQHWVIDDPIGFKNELLSILEDKEV